MMLLLGVLGVLGVLGEVSTEDIACIDDSDCVILGEIRLSKNQFRSKFRSWEPLNKEW